MNITYNDGEDWMIANTPAVGQFYAINVDHQKPYQVYGGLQDNGGGRRSITAQQIAGG